MRPILPIAALISVSVSVNAAESFEDITVELTRNDAGVVILCEIEFPQGSEHSSTTTDKLRSQCSRYLDEKILDRAQRYNGREILLDEIRVTLNTGTNRYRYGFRVRYFNIKTTSNNSLERDGKPPLS